MTGIYRKCQVERNWSLEAEILVAVCFQTIKLRWFLLNVLFFSLSNSQFNTKNACLKNCLNLEQNPVNQLCKIIKPQYSLFLWMDCLILCKNLVIPELDFAVPDNKHCSILPSWYKEMLRKKKMLMRRSSFVNLTYLAAFHVAFVLFLFCFVNSFW